MQILHTISTYFLILGCVYANTPHHAEKAREVKKRDLTLTIETNDDFRAASCSEYECIDYCFNHGYNFGDCKSNGDCQCARSTPEAPMDIEKRDLTIKIKTNDDFRAAKCDAKECFLQCEADGALGGACSSDGECQCARSAPEALVKQSRIKASALHTFEGECSEATCNEVCYQKGGFAGGVCLGGHCACLESAVLDGRISQDGQNGVNAKTCRWIDTPSGWRSVCDDNCASYNDCSSCFLYERCCLNEHCECGTSGRENICK